MKNKITKYKFLTTLIFLLNIESIAQETSKNSSQINWERIINNKKVNEKKSVEWVP